MSTHFRSRPEPTHQASPPLPRQLRPAAGPRVWAGAVIVAGGLGLIVLGGCFLYGVLELVKPMAIHPGFREDASTAVSTLMIVLYLMAFLCFLGAAVLLAVGLCGLARIMRAKPDSPASDY
jgi:hypothetical protein